MEQEGEGAGSGGAYGGDDGSGYAGLRASPRCNHLYRQLHKVTRPTRIQCRRHLRHRRLSGSGQPVHAEGGHPAGQRHLRRGHHQLQHPRQGGDLHVTRPPRRASHNRYGDHRRLHPARTTSQHPGYGHNAVTRSRTVGSNLSGGDGLGITKPITQRDQGTHHKRFG